MKKTMLTDLYQLTMNAAYFGNEKDEVATFDLFVRKLPKDWGYFIANGIEDAIDYATNIQFSNEDVTYLKDQGIFSEEYLNFLKDFKFEGEIYAVKEGTPIFPNEPILRITAKRTQAQFLESTLLNIINFQTMITSKTSRVVNAAKDSKVVDFGLRRAQDEDAAMKGARATYVGGAVATSNVKAGKDYDIPISGTHAHSFVMSFPTELDSFRAYVKTFPNNATLLIDTYDTIEGAKNAAIVGKELEKEGKKLGAVRLDSGDLCKLSKGVRKVLDDVGLDYVRVVASNDLNEYKIEELVNNDAKISGYGVGTEMITAKPVAAISGVYKLVEDTDGAKIKLSKSKKTLPGKKQIYRQDGLDVIALDNEKIDGEHLLELVVKNGKRVNERRSLKEIRNYSLECVKKLPNYLKKTKVEKDYSIKLTNKLENLIKKLTKQYGGGK